MVTFMNPRGWIGTWQSIEPKLALQEIALRYLRAYGPATADDFAFWWGCAKTLAKNLFQSIVGELEEVEVEGWRAFALRATLPHIQSVEPTEQIHLLPLFDAYTIGVPRDCEPLLAQAYRRQVFNLQGWTFAVVLVNGSIQVDSQCYSSTESQEKHTPATMLFSPVRQAHFPKIMGSTYRSLASLELFCNLYATVV
jgi:hypothetical protein